ncbi:lytic transglycosylase domain-containing protein [Roseomonas sp. M0104]|uniref:Lytic transglycosylase domain-containing protein n=1 Tax=Teichococcus coralli TaxID=2545983 RepID=A0A845BB16_9PROT|nr:lytic transglycosylase domain-containing protein [Pseudoroseomonas coralli]MXP62562.1 lytic transglycosylase domain-containing protein [Pseudoroseomonas coralli]
MIRSAFLAAMLALGIALAPPARAAERDAALCRQAIATIAPGAGVPPGLLGAIALVESGRPDPATGRPVPWPWSYNVGGEGFAAPSKAAAVAAVEKLQAQGVRSIDVGCMQVNLLYHPQAFGNLEEAFDPEGNTRYAVRFLRMLQARHSDWGSAVAHYHSGEPERGLAYSRRVALARLGAAWNGGGAAPLPPQLVSGLCARGRVAALRFTAARGGHRLATPRLVCIHSGARQQ